MESDEANMMIVMEMEKEIRKFIKVWILVHISLCYCFVAAKIMSPRILQRLLVLLPVISLFLIFPLNLNSIVLAAITGFFVSWLANFKLLMLVFNHGPLADSLALNSLPCFLALASLPVKIKQKQHFVNEKTPQSLGLFREKPCPEVNEARQRSIMSYVVKAFLLCLIVVMHDYYASVNSTITMSVYNIHGYLFIEIVLAVAAALARLAIGSELEPQFNEPYLLTSVQDLWGRRWNLMVTRVLRPTVYNPVLAFSAKLLGRKWATYPAIMATFIVSGLMHEIVGFYLGHVNPTWEMAQFLFINGAYLVVEIAVKKALGDRCRRFPVTLGRILTLGFFMITMSYTIFPLYSRCEADVRTYQEYVALGMVVKDVARNVTLTCLRIFCI